MIAAGWQIYRAYRGDFEKYLDLSRVQATARVFILRLCAFGLSARGLVFFLMGLFLLKAGWNVNAEEARGLSGALTSLKSQPFGSWLLGIGALGLGAYGLYCAARALLLRR